jgi:putative phage-type endonuclease
MLAADPIDLEPGSPEWLRELTASKVPAILGLSPWESRFSLFYRMAGAVAEQPDTPQPARGHYLEDGICRYVADQYGLTLAPGRCWRNHARPWQCASPDRLVVDPTTMDRIPWGRSVYDSASAVVEVKTAADFELWGPDGTDEIPAHYRAQAVWQCDTLGVPVCYMGVLLPYLELRSYVIRPAAGEAEFIREQCLEFLATLADGDPPDVDATDATWSTLRALHPDIGGDTDVPPELATDYARSLLDLKAARAEHALRRNLLADHMGSARRARLDGRTVAIRQPGPTGIPYVKPAPDRTLWAVLTEESTNA